MNDYNYVKLNISVDGEVRHGEWDFFVCIYISLAVDIPGAVAGHFSGLLSLN